MRNRRTAFITILCVAMISLARVGFGQDAHKPAASERQAGTVETHSLAPPAGAAEGHGDAAHDGVAHDGAAGGGHGGHEKAELLPGLEDPQTYYQGGFVLILFVIVLLLLYPLAWRPALQGLTKREAWIRADRSGASRAQSEMAESLKAYDARIASAEAKIREMLTAAQNAGEKDATAIRMEAQRQAEEAKEQAQRDVDTSKTTALSDLRGQLATLATSMASKVLGRELNADQQQDLVSAKLDA